MKSETIKRGKGQNVPSTRIYRLLLSKVFAGSIFRNSSTLFGLLIINLFVTGTIANLADQGAERAAPDTSSVIFTVIFFPIFETLIFQATPILLARKFSHNKGFLGPVLISAILFASQHLYSPGYFLVAIGAGTILASFYLFLSKKKKFPILVLSVVHAVYNLCMYLLLIAGQ